MILILLLGLVHLRVRACNCIMPGQSIIVAKAGWEFLRFEKLVDVPVVSSGLRTTMGKLIHQMLK
jgi:hypothetical protein